VALFIWQEKEIQSGTQTRLPMPRLTLSRFRALKNRTSLQGRLSHQDAFSTTIDFTIAPPKIAQEGGKGAAKK